MTLIALSYGSAALAYGLLTLVLLARRGAVVQGRRVMLAVGGTALWGVTILIGFAVLGNFSRFIVPLADVMRVACWAAALLAAIPVGPRGHNIRRPVGLAVIALTGAAVVATLFALPARHTNIVLLALSTVGCVTVEQIFRNSTLEQKRVLSTFLWAIGGMFTYDLFVFADASLFSTVDPLLWGLRGFVAMLAVPFFILAAKRHPDWAETLFVSREFVFYSATLAGVGLYLLAVAAGALVLREIGDQWNGTVQVIYLLAALGVLAYVLSSSRLKAQVRVFISKHFYRNRYDYRTEWLRLIRTLSDARQGLPLEQRGIKALAEIVQSRGGQLWLDRDGRRIYEPFGAWHAAFPEGELTSGPLLSFLQELGWVIDSQEYENDPERYHHAFRDDPGALPRDSLCFPLMLGETVFGIVRLDRPADLRELTFEDHDLLKTAGRQVAAFLANDLARERLGEAQQFAAFNKLSAFVMHDVKNVLAQQALLVGNAQKFRNRPEFVDDVIRTLDSGVQRMRRVLRQLEQGTHPGSLRRVDVSKSVLRAVSAQSEAGALRCAVEGDTSLWVRADPEQLQSVIVHVIQNAQEATAEGGEVRVRASEAGGRAIVEVCDTGQGMSEEFIRRKLFKPFETTKGSSGMGIGAYQAREIVRGLGGDLSVTSEVGKGTVVTIALPLEGPVVGARP